MLVLYTVSAEYCVIRDGSHGTRVFVFVVAERLRKHEWNRKTAKGEMAGGEKGKSPDTQELLWEPFPVICIVALWTPRPCSVGLGPVYSASAHTLLLINWKCCCAALDRIGAGSRANTFAVGDENEMVYDKTFREERQRLPLFNCVRQVHPMMTQGPLNAWLVFRLSLTERKGFK